MDEICFRDVTILYTEQDEAWCQYLSQNFTLDKLNIEALKTKLAKENIESLKASLMKLNIHTLNVSRLVYTSPPEIEVAIRESYVVVLLVTSHFLDYMEAQYEWFSKMLKEKRNSNFTTILASLVCITPDECNQVLTDYSYVNETNDDYQLVEVDVSGSNIQQVVETILDYRDKNEKKRIPPKVKSNITVVPTTIHGHGDTVALLFTEEIKGEVTVSFNGIEEEVKTKKINPYCVTFIVPDVVGEKIGFKIIDGVRSVRCCLKNKSMGLNITSVEFLCQSYGLSGKEELDKKLADHFNKSLCSDGKASKILDEILDSPLTESIDKKNKYPTILHWAAANGLSELCSALLSSVSASATACSISNCDGHDPAELARVNGYQEIYDLLFDFAEAKYIADSCDLYVQCFTKTADQSQDDYEIMQPSLPGAPKFPNKRKTSPPPLPTTRPPFINKKPEKPSDNDDIYIHPDEVLPLAPPASKVTLPHGAVGSRSQTELIRIQEEVRNGTFSIQEAEMLFKAWKERYETGNAVSFKERQHTLQTLRTAHNKTFNLFKEGKQKKKKNITKEDSFTAEISEPFAMRPTNKLTGARDSNASTTSSLSSVRTSSDSGRDSSDSHLFSSFDDIDCGEIIQKPHEIPRRSITLSTGANKEKRLSTKEMYIVLRDYPEVNSLTLPPPLPPPRITQARPTTIKAVAGKPEPDIHSRIPPNVAPKPKTPSVKK